MSYDKEAVEYACDFYFIKVRPKERTVAEVLSEEYAFKSGYAAGVKWERERTRELLRLAGERIYYWKSMANGAANELQHIPLVFRGESEPILKQIQDELLREK